MMTKSLLVVGDALGVMSGCATATFEAVGDGFVCVSASKGLKFLIGQVDEGKSVDDQLRQLGVRWEWRDCVASAIGMKRRLRANVERDPITIRDRATMRERFCL